VSLNAPSAAAAPSASPAQDAAASAGAASETGASTEKPAISLTVEVPAAQSNAAGGVADDDDGKGASEEVHHWPAPDPNKKVLYDLYAVIVSSCCLRSVVACC